MDAQVKPNVDVQEDFHHEGEQVGCRYGGGFRCWSFSITFVYRMYM